MINVSVLKIQFSIMEKCFVWYLYFRRITKTNVNQNFFNYRKFTFKSKSSLSLCIDSDSEDELKRSVAVSQRLCEMSSSEQQQEDLEKVSNFSSEHLMEICDALTVPQNTFYIQYQQMEGITQGGSAAQWLHSDTCHEVSVWVF